MLLRFLQKTFPCTEYLVSLRTFIGLANLYSNERLNLAVCILQFYGKMIVHYHGTVETCTKRLKDEREFGKKTNSFLDCQTAKIGEIISIKRLVIILLLHLFPGHLTPEN